MVSLASMRPEGLPMRRTTQSGKGYPVSAAAGRGRQGSGGRRWRGVVAVLGAGYSERP